MQISWNEVREVNTTLKKMKSRLSTNIMRKVKPLMWESGYSKGDLFETNKEPKNHF